MRTDSNLHLSILLPSPYSSLSYNPIKSLVTASSLFVCFSLGSTFPPALLSPLMF